MSSVILHLHEEYYLEINAWWLQPGWLISAKSVHTYPLNCAVQLSFLFSIHLYFWLSEVEMYIAEHTGMHKYLCIFQIRSEACIK